MLAAKLLAERQNPTDMAHGPFVSHRNALRVVTNLRLSTRESEFSSSYYSSSSSVNDLAPRREV